jgi:hypothetical protein
MTNLALLLLATKDRGHPMPQLDPVTESAR